MSTTLNFVITEKDTVLTAIGSTGNQSVINITDTDSEKKLKSLLIDIMKLQQTRELIDTTNFQEIKTNN